MTDPISIATTVLGIVTKVYDQVKQFKENQSDFQHTADVLHQILNHTNTIKEILTANKSLVDEALTQCFSSVERDVKSAQEFVLKFQDAMAKGGKKARRLLNAKDDSLTLVKINSRLDGASGRLHAQHYATTERNKCKKYEINYDDLIAEFVAEGDTVEAREFWFLLLKQLPEKKRDVKQAVNITRIFHLFIATYGVEPSQKQREDLLEKFTFGNLNGKVQGKDFCSKCGIGFPKSFHDGASIQLTRLPAKDRPKAVEVLLARIEVETFGSQGSSDHINAALEEHVSGENFSMKFQSIEALQTHVAHGLYDTTLKMVVNTVHLAEFHQHAQAQKEEGKAAFETTNIPPDYAVGCNQNLIKQMVLSRTADKMTYTMTGKVHDEECLTLVAIGSAGMPLVANDTAFYYEVDILRCPKVDPESSDDFGVSIGLLPAGIDTERDRFTKWDMTPIGYEYGIALNAAGDLDASSGGFGRKIDGAAFASNDVIGCGWDPLIRRIYFTKNGALIPRALQAVPESSKWAIAASLDFEVQIGTQIRFNLQGPFKYNVSSSANEALDILVPPKVETQAPFTLMQPAGERFLAYSKYNISGVLRRSADTHDYIQEKRPQSRFPGALVQSAQAYKLGSGPAAAGLYFELTVLQGPASIGLAANGNLGDMKSPPGQCGRNSIGFGIYDGVSSICTFSPALKARLETAGQIPNIRNGSTLGVGWNPLVGEVFFTLDGKIVGSVVLTESEFANRTVHVVGYTGGVKAHIRINAGEQPFKFDLNTSRRPPVEGGIRWLFDRVDVDASGEIDEEEFKQLAHHLGLHLPDSTANAIVKELDKSGNGSVNYDDFAARFKSPDDVRSYMEKYGAEKPQAPRSVAPKSTATAAATRPDPPLRADSFFTMFEQLRLREQEQRQEEKRWAVSDLQDDASSGEESDDDYFAEVPARRELPSDRLCDSCGRCPPKGKYYQCQKCPEYDLCETCHRRGVHGMHRGSLKHVSGPGPGAPTAVRGPGQSTGYNVRVGSPAAAPAREVHANVRCDGCSLTPVVGPCFSCARCPNYDLCQKCVTRGVHASHPLMRRALTASANRLAGAATSPSQLRNIPTARAPVAQREVHAMVRCDGCSVAPVIGPCYKCELCSDFDLCLQCVKRGIHALHPMVRRAPPAASGGRDAEMLRLMRLMQI